MSARHLANATITLYHGSDVRIERPDVSHNTGFADLGHGFYLTDDYLAARRRASSRARKTGAFEGVVSAYELDAGCVPWATWDAEVPTLAGLAPDAPFGLCFAPTGAGIVAWANYIKACRGGHTEVPGLGQPAIVRAWIATEEVEMACSGFVEAAELADFVDPTRLTVQYRLLDQDLIDKNLRFTGAVEVDRGFFG